MPRIDDIDLKKVIKDVMEIFPSCTFKIHKSFVKEGVLDIEQTRIFEIKQPFNHQPRREQGTNNLLQEGLAMYDGFELQALLARSLQNDIHIIITRLLMCTFSEDDWRYHARTIICGAPSIISTTGIVEAPAKPKEFYLPMVGFSPPDWNLLKKKYAGQFIEYGDKRMVQAIVGYVLQALFYFLTDGEPFCNNKKCRLYNSHWQKELIATQIAKNAALCKKHRLLANKYAANNL